MIKEQIDNILKKHNININTLAKLIGTTYLSIYRWRNNKVKMSGRHETALDIIEKMSEEEFIKFNSPIMSVYNYYEFPFMAKYIFFKLEFSIDIVKKVIEEINNGRK